MEMMTQEELEEFLSKPILARIATVGKDCAPHIAPVWFIYDDGAIMIGTRKDTTKIRNIKNIAPSPTHMVYLRVKSFDTHFE